MIISSNNVTAAGWLPPLRVATLSFALAAALATMALAEPGNRVSIADFGAVPNDGQNDAVAMRKALDYAQTHPGATLYFPPGTYDYRDEKAVKLMDDILNGVIKGNPQDTIFKPYYPYAKGLDFNGITNVTVEAAGAWLLCDGWMEPVSLNHCQGVKIKGLTIDYKRKPNSVGKIVDVQPGHYDAEFDPIYPLTKEMPLCRTLYWSSVAHRARFNEDYFPKHEIIGPQKMRLYSKLPAEMKGDYVMFVHTFHFRPAIFMLEAQDVTLEDVTIHSQPGMGIVGHRSQDIMMRGLRIVPNAGRIGSSNTDATHFTSCSGQLTYENCQFEGHGDDAVNIHNYYYTLYKPATGPGYDLVVTNADWHAQVLDYPDAGDTLELVDKNTLAPVKTVQVKTSDPNIPKLRTRVTLSEELPASLENYYLINVSRLPRVRLAGCVVTSNRARGFLIKTRHVLIERCLLRECTGSGIHVGAEGGWHEGPASADVTIRYNRILRCSGGAGSVGASGIAVNIGAPNDKVPGLHQRLVIEGNIIEGEHADYGIHISGASDVGVRYNEISGCETPVKIEHCTRVEVCSNPGVPDLQASEIP